MGDATYRIAECREEDLDRLFARFMEAYPNNPRLQEQDYFDWEYKRTPFRPTGQYTFLVHGNGDVVDGFIGVVPVQVRYQGEIHEGCWLQNWYDWRRDVSALRLLFKAMADYPIRFMVGTTPDSNRIYKAMGFSLLAELPRWIGVLNAAKVAQICEIRDPADGELIAGSASRLRQLGDGDHVATIRRFDNGEEFHLKGIEMIQGYVRRTARFLNWRYIDIPRHNYRILRGGQDQFVVYRIEEITGQAEKCYVIHILEWFAWGPWEQECVATIVAEGNAAKAILIDFFCTSPAVSEGLVRLGFLARGDFRDRPPPYLFRPPCWRQELSLAVDACPAGHRQAVDFSQWYITKGDSNVDRVKR